MWDWMSYKDELICNNNYINIFFLKDLLIIELIVFFWWFNLSLGAHCGFVIEQMCYLFVAT